MIWTQVMLLHAFPDHPRAAMLLQRLTALSCASVDKTCAAAQVRRPTLQQSTDGSHAIDF